MVLLSQQLYSQPTLAQLEWTGVGLSWCFLSLMVIGLHSSLVFTEVKGSGGRAEGDEVLYFGWQFERGLHELKLQ